MSIVTLYEISDHLLALVDTLEMCDTEEKRAECEADIVATVAAQIQKTDDFAHFLAHLESQAEFADSEIERVKQRKQTLVNTQKRLEQYAIRVMQNLNVKKMKGNTTELSLRQNAAAVEITDEAQVPAEFKIVHQTVTVDKRAVKKAIESGAEVPGADLHFGTISLVRK